MGRFDSPPSVEQQTLARVESGLSAILDALTALGHLPAPQVNVAAPAAPNVDVTVPTEPLVQALAGLQQQILEAIDRPMPEPSVNLSSPEVVVDLAPLHEQQEQLRLLVEAVTQKIGNLTSGNRSHFDGRVLDKSGNRVNPATNETLEQIAAGLGVAPTVEIDTRLDYDVRVDGNPVYVGKAPLGTSTAASDWTITYLEYDISSRLVRSRVRDDVVWDDRATLF